MPKTHALHVLAGDRLTLLQYAAAARLVGEPPARLPETEDFGTGGQLDGRASDLDEIEGAQGLRRGAPQLPPSLRGDHSQRWLNDMLFALPPSDPDLSWLQQWQQLVEAIEPIVRDDEPPLRDLLNNVRAASHPRDLTSGVVDARFWPSLRRLGVSRHPVDLIVAGYGATNYLLADAGRPPDTAPASARDRRAVTRVCKGLSILALGAYPFNSAAMSLLSALCWWDADQLTRRVERPSGRRLARAFDRGVRINIKVGDPVEPRRREFFETVLSAGAKMVNEPHSATSSSSPALRLARLLLIRHPCLAGDPEFKSSPAYNGAIVRQILTRMSNLARGKDDTTDVILRREALWYLLEAEPAIAPILGSIPNQKTPEAMATDLGNDKPHVFGDLLAMREELNRRRHIGPPEQGMATRWPQNFDDFARDRTLTLEVWREAAHAAPKGLPKWMQLIDRHLNPGHVPRTAPWRHVTRQIAVPTVSLLYEALFTPWSARARWIAGAFRAAGSPVQLAAASSLEDIMRDAAAEAAEGPGNGIPAKRAAWLIGLTTPPHPALLRTMRTIALSDKIPHDVVASVVWAMGDLLASLGETPLRPEVEACFRDLTHAALAHARRSLSDAVETGGRFDTGPLVIAQASFHGLALQQHSLHADWVGSQHDEFRDLAASMRESGSYREQGRAQRFLRHMGATTAMAEWALQRMDADVALATD